MFLKVIVLQLPYYMPCMSVSWTVGSEWGRKIRWHRELSVHEYMYENEEKKQKNEEEEEGKRIS